MKTEAAIVEFPKNLMSNGLYMMDGSTVQSQLFEGVIVVVDEARNVRGIR